MSETFFENWTLFLDRDGVINKRKMDGYIECIEQFEFIDGVKDALHFLRPLFSRCIVVTNQQGVGKGIMTQAELVKIHTWMSSELFIENKVIIDKVLFCTALRSENSNFRKPNIGMALEARNCYPEIDFKTSIMLGDTSSDMLFARKAGMIAIWIKSNEEECVNADLYDLSFPSLLHFARNLAMVKEYILGVQ